MAKQNKTKRKKKTNIFSFFPVCRLLSLGLIFQFNYDKEIIFFVLFLHFIFYTYSRLDWICNSLNGSFLFNKRQMNFSPTLLWNCKNFYRFFFLNLCIFIFLFCNCQFYLSFVALMSIFKFIVLEMYRIAATNWFWYLLRKSIGPIHW